MDIQSLADKLAEKREQMNKLVTNATDLKDKIKNATSIEDAERFDKDLTKNSVDTSALAGEISGLEKQIAENGGNHHMAHKEVKNYLDTKQAVKDWAESFQNSASRAEAEDKWAGKLAENGVTIEGDTTSLPTQVNLGIQSTIAENPIFDIMQHVAGGTLVYKKFSTSDKAIGRGTGYNITENKTEQNSTLEVKDLPQNEIYKLTSVSYKVLKNLGSEITPFITNELTQYVIDRIVELALYDGTGSADAATAGFDAIAADDSGAVHVEIPDGTSLSTAIRANAFRASGAGAVVVNNTGKDAGQANRVLIVNSTDYAAILGDALALNYNVDNLPGWLGVDSVIIKDTDSKNYKPIVLTRNAYIVAADAFDKFDWYNILNNRSQSEVVTLANGTLFAANTAVVFTPAAVTPAP